MKRLFLGQTAVDFWGRRKWGLGISLVLVIISVISLSTRQLNLGIDFEGGVAYDIPAAQLSVDDARAVLDDNGLEGSDAKVEERSSASGDILKVQIKDQPEEVRVELQEAFAEAAGVEPSEVSVASVSASWGEQITRKAITALVVFLALIAVVHRVALRMAHGHRRDHRHDPRRRRLCGHLLDLRIRGHAVDRHRVPHDPRLLAVRHDRGVRPGQGERAARRRGGTLGRRPRERVGQPGTDAFAEHVACRRFCRSSHCCSSAPACSVRSTLREFAIALLIGMLTGAYSSIFLATPILGMLKRKMRPERVAAGEVDHLTGEELRIVVVRGVGVLAPRTSRRRSRGSSRATDASFGPQVYGPGDSVDDGGTTLVEERGRPQSSLLPPDATTEQLLGRQARPRKKKRH